MSQLLNWQFWAVIVGVAAIVVSVWLYRRQSLKSLSYGVLVSRAVSIEDTVAERVKIQVEGQFVDALYSVLVRIGNSGNLPINSDDFEGPMSIVLGNGSVISTSIPEARPELLRDRVTMTARQNFLDIEPVLLNQPESFIVQILTDREESRDTVSLQVRISGVAYNDLRCVEFDDFPGIRRRIGLGDFIQNSLFAFTAIAVVGLIVWLGAKAGIDWTDVKVVEYFALIMGVMLVLSVASGIVVGKVFERTRDRLRLWATSRRRSDAANTVLRLDCAIWYVVELEPHVPCSFAFAKHTCLRRRRANARPRRCGRQTADHYSSTMQEKGWVEGESVYRLNSIRLPRPIGTVVK